MNILHTFTRRCLKQNKSRTLVTIIGIVLSVALCTAVIEGAFSGLQFLINCEKAAQGSWLAGYAELTGQELEQVREDKEIKQYAFHELAGATVTQAGTLCDIYTLEGWDDDMKTVELLQGRLPENDRELMVPESALSSGAEYALGDSITLPLQTQWDENHRGIGEAEERTYTLVGICRGSTRFEQHSWGRYVFYTAGQGCGIYDCYFTVRHVSKMMDYVQSQTISTACFFHSELLYYMGAGASSTLNRMIYGFAAVLVALIALGSISLIYNSFAISVSERTRLLGILKSVGATGSQVRSAVLYEALVLSVVGIPLGLLVGCGGIGLTLYLLKDAFSAFSSAGGVSIHLVVRPLPLLVAAAVCLLTTLISAWIPARRAAKVSVMDAVRQTGDLKIRAKELKVSGLTQKLFGFEGLMAAKNFKRNRRRYRSVVLSLSLSIILFISAASFCSYLTDSVSGIAGGETSADLYFYSVGAEERGENPEDLLQLLLSAEGVAGGEYVQSDYTSMKVPSALLDDSYLEAMEFNRNELAQTIESGIGIAFINDDAFRDLCQRSGLDADSFMNPDSPRALVCNRERNRCYTEDGVKVRSYRLLKASALPASLLYESVAEVPGYSFGWEEEQDDGSSRYLYFPSDYLEQLWSSEGDQAPDPAKGLYLSREEAVTAVELEVGAVTDEGTLLVGNGSCALVYPYSLKQTVMGEAAEAIGFQTDYAFSARNHSEAYSSMKALLLNQGESTSRLTDVAAERESERMLITVVRVFSYGFIVLISLISAANVFNTVSTNVILRRREFAMLRSVGLGKRGFSKMMNFECLIYGARGLLWGLPVAVLFTYAIFRVAGFAYESGFFLPWGSVAIAVGSVFAVVFATMLYASGKVRQDNTVDALKNENL